MGAAVGMREPTGSRTEPCTPYSGSMPSIMDSTESVRATSSVRGLPSPPAALSRRHSAAMTPKAA